LDYKKTLAYYKQIGLENMDNTNTIGWTRKYCSKHELNVENYKQDLSKKV